MDPCWFGNNLPWPHFPELKEASELTQADLMDYDVVIFIGGVSNDPMAEYDPYTNYKGNLADPVHLAHLTAKASNITGPKKFIYASSCSVYGYTDDAAMTETDTCNVEFPYGVAKHISEMGIMYLESHTFKPIIMRKGTIGGWSPRMRFDLVVNAMFKAAMTGGNINVYDGSLWRPVIDNRDVAQAYMAAIEADIDVTGIFNIGHSNKRVGEIADEIASAVKKIANVDCTITDHHKNDVRNYAAITHKAERVLGFNARYSITETIAHLFEMIPKDMDYNDMKYYNIEVFKHLK